MFDDVNYSDYTNSRMLGERYESLMDYLQKLKNLRNTLKELKSQLNPDLLKKVDLTDPESIDKLASGLKVVRYKEELKNLKDRIQSYENFLMAYASNPSVKEMIKALEERNVPLYKKAYMEVLSIHYDKQSYEKLQKDLDEIKRKVPNLIKQLLNNPKDSKWDELLSQLPKAWAWAQAKDWLEEFSNRDYEYINEKLKDIERRKFKLIGEIINLKALNHLKDKITKEDIRYITAWKQSMKRLGKGTGKYAERYRKDAQEHLRKVVHVIPAWIMPLHRVWDTVKPEKEIFDFLIVDEASQIGFEGIPLLYLAKKVIVIGDDKQIVPEAVGIHREDVFKLINEYLYDLRFKDSFYVDNSLFHHVELRYADTKVALREHFRCMPEIIEFCNQLCYTETRLIPLRQYPPDRLNPIEKVYVPNAFCEGDGQYIKNEIEAEYIANKIREICEDKRYKEKTIGVVVLQGKNQAKVIEKKLFEVLSEEEIHKRKIVVGDPYMFQGDERDIIFLSMVIAPNKNIGVLSDENDRRRFNVAVSRARDQIWLFHSVLEKDLSPKCFRRQLLEYFYNTKPKKIAGYTLKELEELRYKQKWAEKDKPPDPFQSWFEVDVLIELVSKGYNVIPQYQVGPYRIDLVVEGGHNRVAVECDGDLYHGADALERDLFRQRVLERAGWRFFRILASDFYYKKEEVLEDLFQYLKKNGIYPVS
ncbi:MAG: AAA domain-containing protein [Aquificaceae bacterium]